MSKICSQNLLKWNEISDFLSLSIISRVTAGQISSEIDIVRFHFSCFHPPISSQSSPMVEKRRLSCGICKRSQRTDYSDPNKSSSSFFFPQLSSRERFSFFLRKSDTGASTWSLNRGNYVISSRNDRASLQKRQSSFEERDLLKSSAMNHQPLRFCRNCYCRLYVSLINYRF